MDKLQLKRFYIVKVGILKDYNSFEGNCFLYAYCSKKKAKEYIKEVLSMEYCKSRHLYFKGNEIAEIISLLTQD